MKRASEVLPTPGGPQKISDGILPPSISFTKAHELILDIFIYGICTIKGHKLINEYRKIKEQE